MLTFNVKKDLTSLHKIKIALPGYTTNRVLANTINSIGVEK